MRLTRRRFLAAIAAIPLAGKALDQLEQLAPDPAIRIRQYVGRIDISDEVRAKTQGSREAFEGWLDTELPRMEESLSAQLNRQFSSAGFEPLIGSDTLELEAAENFYSVDAAYFSIPVDLDRRAS